MAKRMPTEQQALLIGSRGRLAVRACPGSGKTFTVAAHLDSRLRSWALPHAGIAAVSFTNVAWEEIRAYLRDDFGLHGALGYPHFLGTIDSFTNQYIFLRFGHLVTGHSPVRLTGPPFDNLSPEAKWLPWGKGNDACYRRGAGTRGCHLNDFTYDMDGQVIHMYDEDRFAGCAVANKPCLRNKRTFTSKGFATQADANYLCLNVLRRYPAVARSLAHRFPVLVVDEAQDSSDIQMAILEVLVDSGVEDVLLVGDPDQAIYEWRKARPGLFTAKVEAWACPVVIDQNWRSSQAICDAVSCISTLPKAMEACSPEVRAIADAPHVWEYGGEQELVALRDKFLKLALAQGIAHDKCAVLARSRDLVEVLRGLGGSADADPWNDQLTRFLVHARFLWDQGRYPEAFTEAERGLLSVLRGERYPDNLCLGRARDAEGFTKWRMFCHRILLVLPATDCSLGDWVAQANGVLSRIKELEGRQLKVKRGSNKCDYPSLLIGALFRAPADCVPLCDTVHGVKGATFEAVMVILKHKAGSGQSYVKLLANEAFSGEEMRIVYVGLTRPRRLLVLCVPSGDRDEWARALGLVEQAVRDGA
jgi:DNA helicase-2/ATP-dependent DNA helicase PcrA